MQTLWVWGQYPPPWCGEKARSGGLGQLTQKEGPGGNYCLIDALALPARLSRIFSEQHKDENKDFQYVLQQTDRYIDSKSGIRIKGASNYPVFFALASDHCTLHGAGYIPAYG